MNDIHGMNVALWLIALAAWSEFLGLRQPIRDGLAKAWRRAGAPYRWCVGVWHDVKGAWEDGKRLATQPPVIAMKLPCPHGVDRYYALCKDCGDGQAHKLDQETIDWMNAPMGPPTPPKVTGKKRKRRPKKKGA